MPWVLFRKMFLMVTFTRDKKSNFPKTETIEKNSVHFIKLLLTVS